MKNNSGIPAWAWTLPFALLPSCGGDESRGALPDWGAGYADGGGGGDGSQVLEGDRMSLAAADDIGLPARVYEQQTLADCAIDIDGTREGRREIFCQMEFNELDLWAYGLVFDFHVPAGACEWIEYWHYQYEKFETNLGPDTVSYTVDDNGNYTNEVNSRNGEPVCAYDYSKIDSDWPNCCLGTYTRSVTDLETGETTTYPPKSWDGEPAECHAGAAYADDEAVFDEDGWPVHTLVFVARQAFDKRFELGSSSLDYGTNVAYANYYDPADHDGVAPAGLIERPLFNRVEPYYNFYCLDHAYEVLGSIRLVVREWNEEREFFATDADGNFIGDPDTVGEEPGTTYPINDLLDWRDATPGSTTWIGDID